MKNSSRKHVEDQIQLKTNENLLVGEKCSVFKSFGQFGMVLTLSWLMHSTLGPMRSALLMRSALVILHSLKPVDAQRQSNAQR